MAWSFRACTQGQKKRCLSEQSITDAGSFVSTIAMIGSAFLDRRPF